MADTKGPKPEENLVTQEYADDVIGTVEGITAQRALDLIEDPERVNLERAVAMVNKKFAGRLKVNLNDIIFRSLAGNRVGEAAADGTFIDPMMLMHPAVRLAHVIAHELAHQKGEVDPEGMVETYVALFMPDGEDDIEHSYDQNKADFEKFVNMVKGEKSFKESVVQIYDLYAAGKYEEIYEMMGLSKDPEDLEADAGDTLFRKIFPELDHQTETGKMGLNLMD